MEHYYYMLWACSFLLIWLALFLYRKDTRVEMLLISLFFGFGGLASEKTYVQDWWHPLTLTNTAVGIEDFIIGFAIGGIAAVIYEDLYHRKMRRYVLKKSAPIDPGFFLLLFPLLYLSLFYLLNINSFYATVAALSGCTLYMLGTRRDLILNSLLSGVCMMVLGVVTYFIILIIDPTFIKDYWYLPHTWYGKVVWGVPIQEYLWYFLVGAYIGPLYEYLKRFKLIPLP